MSDFKIELNDEGIQELLKSDEIHSVMEQSAQRIIDQHGKGYEYSTRRRIGRTRQTVSVDANSMRAYNHGKKVSWL